MLDEKNLISCGCSLGTSSPLKSCKNLAAKKANEQRGEKIIINYIANKR